MVPKRGFGEALGSSLLGLQTASSLRVLFHYSSIFTGKTVAREGGCRISLCRLLGHFLTTSFLRRVVALTHMAGNSFHRKLLGLS